MPDLRIASPFRSFEPRIIVESGVPTAVHEALAMIHVIATIRAATGRRQELLAAFRELLPSVRAETGCLEYGPAVDLATPVGGPAERDDVVTVIEKWDSVEALEKHLAAPHMAAYRQKVKDLVAGVEIRVLRPA